MPRIRDLGARKNARLRELLGDLREVRELRELLNLREFRYKYSEYMFVNEK